MSHFAETTLPLAVVRWIYRAIVHCRAIYLFGKYTNGREKARGRTGPLSRARKVSNDALLHSAGAPYCIVLRRIREETGGKRRQLIVL